MRTSVRASALSPQKAPKLPVLLQATLMKLTGSFFLKKERYENRQGAIWGWGTTMMGVGRGWRGQWEANMMKIFYKYA